MDGAVPTPDAAACIDGTCTMPPAAVCLDETRLRTFASVGTCEDDLCSYGATDTTCADGCENGACLPPCNARRWRQLAPTTKPLSRETHAMAYDPVADVSVMFGGWNYGPDTIGDTWTFDGNAWVERELTPYPGRLERFGMAYDPDRGKTVVFGGWKNDSARTNQVWELDQTGWAQRTLSGAPSARSGPAIAYDPVRHKLVVFGGNTGGNGGLETSAETWELSSTGWAQITTAHAPIPRSSAAMAYDPIRGKIVLFGGATNYNGPTEWLGDLWEFDGTDWTQRVLTPSPTARVYASLVYDEAREQLVLFGGTKDGGANTDRTWLLTASGWSEDTASPSPTRRSGPAMAYDVARRRLVLFAGSNAGVVNGTLDDTWVYECVE